MLALIFVSGVADVVAPILSLASALATGATTATGQVSTDETGTLYFYASENASETAGTIKAESSQAVTATGLQNVSFTGLTENTTYYAHFVQDDASSNESNVLTSASFTTQFAAHAPSGFTRSLSFKGNNRKGSFMGKNRKMA